jgi:hypothetical protein
MTEDWRLSDMIPAADWNGKVRAFLPPFGGFLQSYEWGEFQESLGFRVKRLFEQTKKGVSLPRLSNNP